VLVASSASLLLPRERHTVRTARSLLESSLTDAGVVHDEVADLAVALSEACSNAVRHADGTSCYRVEIEVHDDDCTMVVADEGTGFVEEGNTMPPPSAAGGRGLALIDALVDRVEVDARPGRGSRITMVKHLSHHRRPSFPGRGRGYGPRNT
jgi:serine/threonine-protein kinase RsbW